MKEFRNKPQPKSPAPQMNLAKRRMPTRIRILSPRFLSHPGFAKKLHETRRYPVVYEIHLGRGVFGLGFNSKFFHSRNDKNDIDF